MSIDPFIANIFFDSCAFDNPHNDENKFAEALLKNKDLRILISYSNVEEIGHSNTPDKTKHMASDLICTEQVNFVSSELMLKERILDILTGKGKRENMQKDAEHLFEANKYGNYFITTDKRLLKKCNEVYTLGVSCMIMLPSEFYTLVERFEELNKLERDIWSLHAERDQYAKNSQEYKGLDSKARKLEAIWSKNASYQ